MASLEERGDVDQDSKKKQMKSETKLQMWTPEIYRSLFFVLLFCFCVCVCDFFFYGVDGFKWDDFDQTCCNK